MNSSLKNRVINAILYSCFCDFNDVEFDTIKRYSTEIITYIKNNTSTEVKWIKILIDIDNLNTIEAIDFDCPD